jgi:hypothetical protein
LGHILPAYERVIQELMVGGRYAYHLAPPNVALKAIATIKDIEMKHALKRQDYC